MTTVNLEGSKSRGRALDGLHLWGSRVATAPRRQSETNSAQMIIEPWDGAPTTG